MKKKATAPRKKKPTGTYKASLIVMGRRYEASGASALEAITNLKAPNSKGKGILVVSNENVTKERILNAGVTFRLFSASGLMREIAIKQMSILFDGI